MPPKAASESDIARGKRLEKWLEQVAPDVKASYRGMVVLEEPRQTVNNWLKGSKISNDGICKIIEAGGYGALAFILGTKPYISNAKTTHEPDEVLIHGKGVNFWYKQYIREKARTVLNEKQDYSKFPQEAKEALEAADAYARVRASSIRSSGSRKPRTQKHELA